MVSRPLTPPNLSVLPRSQQFEQECVFLFEEIVQVFGVPKSVGQIYGLLFASPDPLTFSDIVKKLHISKGSASQGLQLLRSLGAINVADTSSGESSSVNRLAGASGRVAYQPDVRLRKLIAGVLTERIAPMAITGSERLIKLRILAEGHGAGNEFYMGRTKQLERWRRRLRVALPMLGALLGSEDLKR